MPTWRRVIGVDAVTLQEIANQGIDPPAGSPRRALESHSEMGEVGCRRSGNPTEIDEADSVEIEQHVAEAHITVRHDHRTITVDLVGQFGP